MHDILLQLLASCVVVPLSLVLGALLMRSLYGGCWCGVDRLRRWVL